MICSVLAEINRDRKKKHDSFKPSDFMPKYEAVGTKPNHVEQSPETMKQQARLITQMLGGKVI